MYLSTDLVKLALQIIDTDKMQILASEKGLKPGDELTVCNTPKLISWSSSLNFSEPPVPPPSDRKSSKTHTSHPSSSTLQQNGPWPSPLHATAAHRRAAETSQAPRT